jgi:hypothetical protein
VAVVVQRLNIELDLKSQNIIIRVGIN